MTEHAAQLEVRMKNAGRGTSLSQVVPNLDPPTESVNGASQTQKSEYVCLLCGSRVRLVLDAVADTRFGIGGKYDIYECLACGFEQTSPRPSLSQLKTLYEEQYNFGGETGTVYTRLRERFFTSGLYRLWTKLDGDISFHLRKGKGRLIDIGCNEGRGLSIYASNGFEVQGLELNESAAASARKRGFVVHTCPLNQLNANEPYSVAVLSNVLEHALNPKEMLVDVSRILQHNSEVWISCPNSKSWLRKLFGRSWINWHVPFHISHFSTETLQRLLTNAGFVRVEVRQISPALWVTQSLIVRLFAKKGAKTRELRNSFLTVFLMAFSRFVLFPVLWLGNRLGRGDCLLAVGRKE